MGRTTSIRLDLSDDVKNFENHNLPFKDRFDWEEDGSIYQEAKSVKEQPYDKVLRAKQKVITQ